MTSKKEVPNFSLYFCFPEMTLWMATVLPAVAPSSYVFGRNVLSFYAGQSGEGASVNQGCSRVTGNPRQERARDGDTLFWIQAQAAHVPHACAGHNQSS